MSAVALTNWAVQPPRSLLLFQSVMVSSTMLAIAVSFRPMLSDSIAAAGLAVVSLVLFVLLFTKALKRRASIKVAKPRSLERLAASHWRIIFDDGTCVDGNLCHAWRGWAWVTLKLKPHDQHRGLQLTVWRATVSAAAWHQLQVWTAWELAMSRPRHSRRSSVESF